MIRLINFYHCFGYVGYRKKISSIFYPSICFSTGNFVDNLTQKKFYSSDKSDSNIYCLRGFDHSESVRIIDFFKNIIIEKGEIYDEIHYPWEDDYTHKSSDLYNYFYTRFLWDYYLYVINDESECYVDNIYIVFYKSNPDDDLELKRINNSMEWYGNKDNILYYETISVEDIKILRDKFINAYKMNQFDDLNNSITDFCDRVIRNLMAIWCDGVFDLDDLYFNFIIPEGKDKCYSSIKENNYNLIQTSDSGKKFYSTKTNNYSFGYKNLLLNHTNNSLLLSSYILTKYRLNGKSSRRAYSSYKSSRLNERKGVEKIWFDNYLFPSYFDLFKERLYFSGKVVVGLDYSVIAKIRIGEIYRSIGDKQEHFKFGSINDDSFEMLFEYINDRLEYLYQYPSDSSMDYTSFDSLLLEFYPVYVEDELKKSDLSIFKNKMTTTQYEDTKKIFNYFGHSLLDIEGIPLDFNIKLKDRSMIVAGVNISGIFNLNDNGLNESIMNVSSIEISGIKGLEGFDRFETLFIERLKSNNKDYVLSNESKIYLINFHNKNYIVVLNEVGENMVNKVCYNRFCQIITKCKDTKMEDGNLRRESGNYVNIFNHSNDLVMSEKKIGLNPIKSDVKYVNEYLPNTNIGVLDLETYEDESVGKCYAIGFYTSIDDKCKTYYIDRDLDSNKLMKRCFDEILRPKYKGITFYVHNLGKFDGYFIPKILSVLNNYGDDVDNPYIIESINRNSEILRLVIKKRVDGKVMSLKLNDSLAILPRSLRDLCKDYSLDVSKGHFPYDFCSKNTLFYVGKTPDISYYKDLLDENEFECKNAEEIKIERYKKLYKEDWNLQQECIEYLEKDLLSLHEVLTKVCKSLHSLFDTQMVNQLTVSSMSMSIFLNLYYKPSSKPLPLINDKKMFDDLHNAYYGGRVEVFNPIPEEGSIYYDVNSLYPYASLSPLPGTNCVFREYYLQKPNLSELFGFYYCKVKSPDIYLGLLPFRNDDGVLCFPCGEWEGWYFSEELKFAESHGYSIEVIKGYNFDRVCSVFEDFVHKIYEIKSNPRNETEKNVAKLILNSLIGRFGMDFYKSVTRLVNREKHNYISTTRVVKDTKMIDNDLFLECYIPAINKEICDKFGVDFTKALNYEKYDDVKDTKSYKSVSLTTASAVLSYARIHMAKIMLYIINNGGKIYYHDTDSIVTNLKLPDHLVDKKELGKLKIEHVIKEGLFITDKTYYIRSIEGKVVKRSKGVKNWSLDYNDYLSMFNMEVVEKATKVSSVKNITQGSVLIKTKDDVKLDATLYRKRERIFEKGKWIGTKPIVINSNDTKSNTKSTVTNSNTKLK